MQRTPEEILAARRESYDAAQDRGMDNLRTALDQATEVLRRAEAECDTMLMQLAACRTLHGICITRAQLHDLLKTMRYFLSLQSDKLKAQREIIEFQRRAIEAAAKALEPEIER